MPVDLPPGSGVTLLYAASVPPVVARASVANVEGDELILSLESAGLAKVPAGARVIVAGTTRDTPRVLLRVQTADAARVRGLIERATNPDKREYPRSFGAVPLAYHRVEGAAAEAARAAWMAGSEGPGPAHEPDPFMSFSVVGLAFDDLPRTTDGDTLLLELRVPPDLRTFRAVARVVRVAPIPDDDRASASPTATHRIAVAFEQIEEEGAEALIRYTARIQDAFIEGTP